MKRKHNEGVESLTNVLRKQGIPDLLKPLIYEYRAYGLICNGKIKVFQPSTLNPFNLFIFNRKRYKTMRSLRKSKSLIKQQFITDFSAKESWLLKAIILRSQLTVSSKPMGYLSRKWSLISTRPVFWSMYFARTTQRRTFRS